MSDRVVYGEMYLTVRYDDYAIGSNKKVAPVKVTGKRPSVIPSGAVVIKMRVAMPFQAFRPLSPVGDLVVSMDEIAVPVEVSVA